MESVMQYNPDKHGGISPKTLLNDCKLCKKHPLESFYATIYLSERQL